MAFVITPDSYVFGNINESSTFLITTDNEDYKFEFVNTTSPGNGRVRLDRETNTMTSIQYGRGRYRFVDGDDVYPFNIEVKRPEIDNLEQVTKILEIGQTTSINYTPPTGYTLLRFEAKNLDDDTVTMGTESYTPSVTPNKLGTTEYEIVLSKINYESTETLDGEEEGEEEENNNTEIEYNGGTITFQVVEFSIYPKETTISLLLNEEHVIDYTYLNLDNNGTRADLSIEATYGDVEHCFKLDTKEVTVSNGKAYSIVLTGVSAGDGVITISFDGYAFKTINVIVEDKKGLYLTPDITELKLNYKETVTFENVYFVNNGVKTKVIVDSSNNPPFNYTIVENDPNSNVYTVTVTNTAQEGGVGSLRIRGEGTNEEQRVIDIKCYKMVVPGEIKYEPTANKLSVILSRSYNFTYLYYTNADEIEITIAKPELLEYRLGELTNIPMIPPEDPEGVPTPMRFPDGAVLHSLFLLAKATGKTKVYIKTYLNDRRDLINQVEFDVIILANDDLPDNIQLINLMTKPMPAGRKKDILIEFPEESATLVLKEELSEDAMLEQGEGFDAIETTKPVKDSNPTLFNAELNKTYLFINNRDKDKGPELYVSQDDTVDENKWKNFQTGEYSNTNIVYPNPGEKGFGVGPAPLELSEKIGLRPFDGCWDPNSDNYGNYYDYLGNIYVFIPKHYIIPKSDSNKAGVFPYFGMTYEFSWVETDVFTQATLPRCFINNGKVVPGIFVAKYNSGLSSQGIKNSSRYDSIEENDYVSPRSGSASKPSIYRTVGYGSVGPEGDNYYIESVAFPELQEMALTHKQDANIVDKNGVLLPNLKQLHNMTIFIQTMLTNLSDVHTIASYEKGSDDSVCSKIKDYIAGTLTKRLRDVVATDKNSEVQMYATTEHFPLGDNYYLVRNMYHGANTGDIDPRYKNLFSHNGQACGVFDINGGINVPLLGILVVQDSTNKDSYEIYSLKESVDIAEIDRLTAATVEGINTDSIIFKSSIFDLNNYDKILDIVNNTDIKGLKFLNVNRPFNTHTGKDSLLVAGDIVDKISINSGINFNSFRDGGEGNYSKNYDSSKDYKMCVDKHRNSVFYISALADSEYIDLSKRTQYMSMFTCNYVETYQESLDGGFDKVNHPSGQQDYTGYRTRVLKLIGRWKYDKLSASKYLLSRRHCITPN